MADQSATSSFTSLQHNPGNPIFPTLPGAGDPNVGYISTWPTGASLFLPLFEERTSVVQSATGGVGFGGWFLNQLWVTPVPIDFADIPDEKSIDVTFFSSYLDPVDMESITIPVDALDITAPAGSPIFPITLSSFTDTIFTFTAAQAGPQQFDDDITIVVEGRSFTVRTLGRRVLLLFGEPENGAVEVLNFATNLMRAKSGIEQAFALRLAPYSVIQYTFRFPADLDYKRTLMEALLVGGAPLLPYGVQLWWEAEKITTAAVPADDTIYIDHSNMQVNVGETFVFTTPSREHYFGTIQTLNESPLSVTLEQPIGATLPLGTYGMPARFGHLANDPSKTTKRINLEDMNIAIRTESDIDISNLDANYFDFHTVESPARPIVRSRCMRGDSVTGGIYKEVQTIDSVTGRVFYTGTEPIGEWSTNAHVWCRSKGEIRAWREFLHYMKGSWGTFYFPTFQNDLPLSTPILLGADNDVTVPYMGLSAYLDGAVPYRDVRIRLEDGSIEYKRITTIVDNGDDTETVTFDSVIGSTGSSSLAGTMISWMHLCRIEGDTARFVHTFLGEAELSFKVRSVIE